MRKLSTKEKVLLHLSEHMSKSRNITKIDNITTSLFSQSGIMEHINSPLSGISDSIKSLENENLIEKRKYYIPETGRFRNLYFLTIPGILKAKEIQEHIYTKKIKLREKGNITETSIHSAIEYLKKVAKQRKSTTIINTISVLNNLTTNNILDVRTFLEPEKYIDHSGNIQKIRYFFGRKEELKHIKEFINSKPVFLCITGIAGIGKTTLVSKFVENLKMNIFWHRFYEFSTIRNLLTKLSLFLSKIGRTKLEKYLKRDAITTEEALIILSDEIKGCNILLIFDDFHKAGKDITNFFSSLKELADNTKIIVISRRQISFYDRCDAKVRKTFQEMELDNLEKKYAIRMLHIKGFDQSASEKYYTVTKGHPFLLELITPDSTVEMRRFLDEEILGGLNDDEMNILGLASVFRCPFEEKVFSLKNTSFNRVYDLIEKALIQRSTEAYHLHDLVKEIVYKRLSEQTKRDNHALAAKYYKTIDADEAFLEYIYHFLKTDGQKTVVKELVEKGLELFQKGYGNELMYIMNELDMASIKPKYLIEMLKIKGDIYHLRGELNEAMREYNHGVEITKKIKNALAENVFKRKMGDIYTDKSQWNEALKYYKESLCSLTEIGDNYELAEVYRNIGFIYFRKVMYLKAEKMLKKAIRYGNKSKNLHAVSQAEIDLGVISSQMGDKVKALKYFENALTILQQTNSLIDIPRVYNDIAEVYAIDGNHEKASEYYQRQIEISEKTSNFRLLGYGLSNLGECLEVKGDYAKAKEYYDRAFDIFKKLDEKFMISALYCNYAGLYQHEKDWDNAIKYHNLAIKIMTKLKNKFALAQEYRAFARMWKEKGDYNNAINYLRKAKTIFEKIGAKERIIKVDKELKDLMSGN